MRFRKNRLAHWPGRRLPVSNSSARISHLSPHFNRSLETNVIKVVPGASIAVAKTFKLRKTVVEAYIWLDLGDP